MGNLATKIATSANHTLTWEFNG